MRKILLATTALVAAGGISVASADVDISGSYGVEYYSEGNTGASQDAADVSGDTFNDDGLISFSGSTTADNGLDFGGNMTLNHTGAIEDQGLYIEGDFGYVMAGATDGVVDGMDNFMTPGSAIPENGASTTLGGADGVGLLTSTMIADNPGTEKIGYRSKEMSGFQVGATYEDAGTDATSNNDVTGYIVTYDAGFAKIGYANGSTNSTTSNGANTGRQQYGIGTTLGGITIGAGFGTQKTAGANGNADTSKIDTRDLGLSYSIDDSTGIYAVFTTSEEKIGSNAGDKMTSQTFGLTYTITDGLSTILETASADYTDATAGDTGDGMNQTTAKIVVSF